MKRRSPNHRLVKKHRNYAVQEIASVLRVHKNTVREWIRGGLPTIEGWPILILGQDLIDFLSARSARRRRPCSPGQMYCLRCRAPQFPAGGLVDSVPLNSNISNLTGICPVCETIMHRCVGKAQIQEPRPNKGITSSQALPRLFEIGKPSLNSDFTKEATHHAKTQSQQ